MRTISTWSLALVLASGLFACDRSSSDGSGPSGGEAPNTKQKQGESSPKSDSQGDVPDVRARPFENSDAEPVALSTESTPTLVNLWATWCAPCIAEMPRLAELRDEWSRDELRMIGISVQGPKSRSKLESFRNEHDVPFDVWYAPRPNPLQAFGATAVPATYVYDAAGQLQWSHDGAIETEQLKELKQVVRGLVSE
jgi:thiol-disulfide isomerase/thioredoxin